MWYLIIEIEQKDRHRTHRLYNFENRQNMVKFHSLLKRGDGVISVKCQECTSMGSNRQCLRMCILSTWCDTFAGWMDDGGTAHTAQKPTERTTKGVWKETNWLLFDYIVHPPTQQFDDKVRGNFKFNDFLISSWERKIDSLVA